MTPTPRPELERVSRDQHGAFDYNELNQLGLDAKAIVDFSVNSNPFGPSPQVQQAIDDISPDIYPDRECLQLRQLLAERQQLGINQVVVGNGAAELIWLTAFAFLGRGDVTVTLTPTFGEYARSARLMGAQVYECRASEVYSFMWHFDAVRQVLKYYQPSVVFICNPNNPTGKVIPNEWLHDWATQFPETLFVLDEAYMQFVDGFTSGIILRLPNILAIRSLTKDYALAGLRIGYAVGPVSIIDVLTNARPPWNVNAFAQVAAHAAIQDDDYLKRTLRQLRTAKADLFDALSNQGQLQCIPSETHYFLVKVGAANRFRHQLLLKSLQVRDCTSFGLSEYIRIASKTPEQNKQLIDIL